MNIAAVRAALQKYQDSTNIALLALVFSAIPFVFIVPVAWKDVPGEGASAHFQFQHGVVAIGVILLIVFFITVGNWFAMNKVTRAIDTATTAIYSAPLHPLPTTTTEKIKPE